MLPSLRSFYYRYIFPADPANTWLRHSLKTLAAITVAMVVAIIEQSIVGMTCVLPVFIILLLTDVHTPLMTRLKNQTINWGITAVVLLLLIAAKPIPWLEAIAFFVVVIASLLFGAFQPKYPLSSIIGLIFAVVGLALPIPINQLPLLLLNLLFSIVIIAAVMLLLWPDRLPSQISKAYNTVMLFLGRYISLTVNDASLGNNLLAKQNEFQHAMMAQLLSMEQLANVYESSKQASPLPVPVAQIRQLCNTAIAVSTSFNSLSTRAYLNGPLQELQAYSVAYQQWFKQYINQGKADCTAISKLHTKLVENLTTHKKVIKDTMLHVYHDFLFWDQVVVYLNAFNELLSQAEPRSEHA